MRLLQNALLGVCAVTRLASRDVVATMGDPLRGELTSAQQLLLSNLAEAAPAGDATLLSLYNEEVYPLQPALYAEGFSPAERRAAVERISRGLDLVEGAALGPFLCGPCPTSTDACLFPSVVLLDLVLPTRFGWTEWTDEALFWKRPRLHAWFELMKYERGASEAQANVSGGLEALGVEWDQVGVDAPTSRLRVLPRHAL